jgi:hypothetical protein
MIQRRSSPDLSERVQAKALLRSLRSVSGVGRRFSNLYPEPELELRASSQLSSRRARRAETGPVSARPVRTPQEIREHYRIQTTDLGQLRTLKALAIKNLDYCRSESIQILIDESDTVASESFSKEMHEWVLMHATETIKRLDENIASLTERRSNREAAVQNDILKVRSATQLRHIDELTTIEVNRRAELLAANNRETSEYRHLIKNSQVLAAHDEVSDALRLMDEADTQIDTLRGEWRKEINARYGKKIQIQTQKQMAELDEIQAAFKENMDLIKLGFEDDVVVEKRKAGVWIQRTLQKSMVQLNLEIHKPELRKQIAKGLKAKLREFLKEKHHEDLLGLQ